MEVIQIIAYICTAVFVISVVWRFVKLARLPIHMRWELYPVAHEKGRSQYGGSYLEELDWWTKKRQSSMLGELKVMVPEILLLSGVYEHNKKHWLRTWPFHFGLYLLCGVIVLSIAGGIATASGSVIAPGGGWLAGLVYHLTRICGFAGISLALIGSTALFCRRWFNPSYRAYAKPVDFFNLGFFVVAMAVALIVHLTKDPGFHGLRGFFAHFMTFDLNWGGAGLSGEALLPAIEILLASLLIAYIPLTHMSHFFTKYFMYHDIRWSDEPNLRGSKIEKKLAEPLNYPVSWSASHIKGDGKKTWVDVATADVDEFEKKD